MNIKDSKVLILGITFKENCPDVRNTKVADVVHSLKDFGTNITIFDPIANKEEVKHEYNLEITNELPQEKFDMIMLCVSHNEFKQIEYSKLTNDINVIYDVKNTLNHITVDGKL